jgi:hypothetical protein
MGYCVKQVDSHFYVKRENIDKMLERIKTLCKEKQLPINTDLILKTNNIFDVMNVFHYQIEFDKTENICGIKFNSEKLRDEKYLFKAISPVVESGSYLLMKGEDGYLWDWEFKKGKCKVKAIKEGGKFKVGEATIGIVNKKLLPENIYLIVKEKYDSTAKLYTRNETDYLYGRVSFEYKNEIRTLTILSETEDDYYGKEYDFLKEKDYVHMTLGYDSNAIEVMNGIVSEYGGWIDKNDCDKIEFEYVNEIIKEDKLELQNDKLLELNIVDYETYMQDLYGSYSLDTDEDTLKALSRDCIVDIEKVDERVL